MEDFEKLDNFPGQKKVGTLEFSLHEVVTGRGQTLLKDLENESKTEGAAGKIKITADEQVTSSNEEMNY